MGISACHQHVIRKESRYDDKTMKQENKEECHKISIILKLTKNVKRYLIYRNESILTNKKLKVPLLVVSSVFFPIFMINKEHVTSKIKHIRTCMKTFLLKSCSKEIMRKSAFCIYMQKTNEPRHEKTNILHMRKQRRRSASW